MDVNILEVIFTVLMVMGLNIIWDWILLNRKPKNGVYKKLQEIRDILILADQDGVKLVYFPRQVINDLKDMIQFLGKQEHDNIMSFMELKEKCNSIIRELESQRNNLEVLKDRSIKND